MKETQGHSDKAALRRQFTAIRDGLAHADREQRSAKLCSLLEREVLSGMRSDRSRPLNLCVYAPFRSEASPWPLASSCWEKGDELYAPRMIPDGEGMELRKVEALSDWIPGKWGVPEPDPSCTALIEETQELDAILVPGIAYDCKGARLGYGGGYYDRLYEARQRRGAGEALWIGFAFAIQVVAGQLPAEPHDLKLNALATEACVKWFA